MCKFVLRGAINKNQSLQELFRQAPFRLYYRQLCWNASPTTGQQLPAVLTLHTELQLCLAALSHSSSSQASALSLLCCFSVEMLYESAILSSSGGASAHPAGCDSTARAPQGTKPHPIARIVPYPKAAEQLKSLLQHKTSAVWVSTCSELWQS